MKTAHKLTIGAATAFVLLLGLIFTDGAIAVQLIFGWLSYMVDSLPRVRADWSRIGSAVVWLALFTGGLHWFCRRLYRRDDRRWRVRWTLSGVALVILLFAAGTAAVGIVHQIAFLSDPTVTVYDYPRRSSSYHDAQLATVCAELLDRARSRNLPSVRVLAAEVEMSTVWGYPHNEFDLAGIDGPDGVIETLVMYPRDPRELRRLGVSVASGERWWSVVGKTPREVFAELSRAAATRPATRAATTPAPLRP